MEKKMFKHEQLEREQYLLSFKSKEELVRMITLLEEKVTIKDKYSALIRDISYDYDGCNSVESLKCLIDQIVEWSVNSIMCDVERVVYASRDDEYNILGDKL